MHLTYLTNLTKTIDVAHSDEAVELELGIDVNFTSKNSAGIVEVANIQHTYINKRICYLSSGIGGYSIGFDVNKNIQLTYTHLYADTEKFKSYGESGFVIDSKYRAIEILSTIEERDLRYLKNIFSESTYNNIVKAINRSIYRIIRQLAKADVKSNAENLKKWFSKLPNHTIDYIKSLVSNSSNPESELLFKILKGLVEYDDTGCFSFVNDASSAVINVLRCLGNSKLLFEKFKSNPKYLVRIYYNLDGTSTFNGIQYKNRMLFAEIIRIVCAANSYKGLNNTGDTFKFGEDYFVETNVFDLDEKEEVDLEEKPKTENIPIPVYGMPGVSTNLVVKHEDKGHVVFLQQKKSYYHIEEETYYGMGLETFYFTIKEDENEGPSGHYDPMDVIYYTDLNAEIKISLPCPAIYVKAIADAEEWKQINKTTRIALDVFALIIGVVSLGSASPLVIALSIADIALSATDLVVALNEDELMKTEEGREFLERYNAIAPMIGLGMGLAYLPHLSRSIYLGAKLVARTGVEATRRFLLSSLLRMVKEIDLPHFTKESLKLLGSTDELVAVGFNIGRSKRYLEAGIVFVKGEMKVGDLVEEGVAAIYKGEVIASGKMASIKKQLIPIKNKKGFRLEEALDNLSEISKINKALVKHKIKIKIPKNPYSALESRRRMKKIYDKLENMNNSKKFNPKKPKLSEKGKTVPLSENKVSADYRDTKFLFPSSSGEKSIVKIKLTGIRDKDNILCWELSGINPSDDILKNYVWHHMNDFDPVSGTCIMQLVERDIHIWSKPHYGGTSLVDYFYQKAIYSNKLSLKL